jgi:hypothetical protein
MCWYNKGSPPPFTSKKEVLKLRSVKSIVKPAAKTGKDKTNRIAVKNMDQQKSGTRNISTKRQ